MEGSEPGRSQEGVEARESARFLAGSSERLDLLLHLRDEPGSPRDVADALSVSHRTAQRNLAELAERGWAEKSEGDYRLTTGGELVARTHADYVETLSAVEEYDPFFRHLPDADHAPDPALLGEATIVVATPDRPQAPVSHYVTRLGERPTETIRMLAPAVSRLYHDVHAKLVLSGVETELILAAEAMETARSMNPMEFEVVRRAIELRRHDDPVGVGLTLGDDWGLLATYDDGGPRAIAEFDDPAFLDWAESLYERYRRRSRPVR